jgi:hypothetical protein
MKIQDLTEYLELKKIEAVMKNYYLHGILERNGIVVVDFKTNRFSPAQADGDCETLYETMNNLLQLGYEYDENHETNPASRWWNDFETVESEPIELSTDEQLKMKRHIIQAIENSPPFPEIENK